MAETERSPNDHADDDNGRLDQCKDEITERIRYLIQDQSFGVLCTQGSGQPYGSMIAFAFSDDLGRAVFATPQATRKYALLKECPNVAIVVSNRDKFPGELMKIEAFTVTGRANEITTDDSYSHWATVLRVKHPYLETFLATPSTAIFLVDLFCYYHVSSFQQVQQWRPSGEHDE